jgi:hypothetical protein
MAPGFKSQCRHDYYLRSAVLRRRWDNYNSYLGANGCDLLRLARSGSFAGWTYRYNARSDYALMGWAIEDA